MEAFLLETLLSRGWRRGGEIFWTLEDARRVAGAMIRRKEARAARVLSIQVKLEPVAELPEVTGGLVSAAP